MVEIKQTAIRVLHVLVAFKCTVLVRVKFECLFVSATSVLLLNERIINGRQNFSVGANYLMNCFTFQKRGIRRENSTLSLPDSGSIIKTELDEALGTD